MSSLIQSRGCCVLVIVNGSTLGKHRCRIGQTKSGKFGPYTSACTLQGTLKGFQNNKIPRSLVLIKCVIFKSAQCIKFDPLSIRHFLHSMALFRSRTLLHASGQQVSRLLSDYLIFALQEYTTSWKAFNLVLRCNDRPFYKELIDRKVVENAVVIIHRRLNTLKKYLSFEIGWYNFVASVVFGLILGHAPEIQRKTMAKVTKAKLFR